MKLFTTTSAASRRKSACVIVGIYTNGALGAGAKDINDASSGLIRKLAKDGDVNGNAGTAVMLRDIKNVNATRVLVVGLGKKGNVTVTRFKQAVAAAARSLRGARITEAVSYLGLETVADRSPYYRARYEIEALQDVLYRYSHTKSKKQKAAHKQKKFGIAVASRGDGTDALQGAEHGLAISEGVSLAKELGNLPPNICTPAYLAETAKKLAKSSSRLSTKVLGETEIRRLEMHSFLSVTSGTILPAKLIVMEYKGAGKDKPVVLVGKGITFDAGGISLKPGPGMDEMKFDMCGAASVIGTMSTVAKLKLPVNLTVVVPTCENLPSGTATRPGDIVTSMSGQTIEVLNTDAEGRLILCDALTYSRRFKPAAIIDVATLTGACVIALGHHRSAVMSNDDALAKQIVDAGEAAADTAWPLPIGEEYDKQLESNFADMANVGGRDGGAITAACFLARFADKLNWAHLDIAGTAWKSGKQKGGTGRPVPLLTEFVMQHCGVVP